MYRDVDLLGSVVPCSGQLAGDYNGPREADGIVRHVKKISGPAAEEIKSAEDLDKLKKIEKVVVVRSFCTPTGAYLSTPFLEHLLLAQCTN